MRKRRSSSGNVVVIQTELLETRFAILVTMYQQQLAVFQSSIRQVSAYSLSLRLKFGDYQRFKHLLYEPTHKKELAVCLALALVDILLN